MEEYVCSIRILQGGGDWDRPDHLAPELPPATQNTTIITCCKWWFILIV